MGEREDLSGGSDGNLSDGTDGYNSKVVRLIDEYDLGEAFGEQLEARWRGESGEQESVRSLAKAFNRRLLQQTLDGAGVSYLDGEIDNLYRLLSGDDVSSGARVEARDRLERDGVDLESLERDFISHQTMWNYLRQYRGATQPEDQTDKLDRERENIQRLRSRTDSVVTEKLDRLRSTDELALGEFLVFVDVDVLCQDCGTQYGVADLLERGGCECSE